jgi:hypothetical protein
MPPGSAHDELAGYLADLLAARLLDPLEILLESELGELRERVTARATALAAVLLGDHEQQAASTAIRLVSVLYPSDEPFRPTVAWWGTPLGRTVARLVGHPGVESLTYAEAGAMLGITRQGVHDLVVRHKLERHPDGGVRNTSVRARLRTRAAADAPHDARHEEST